MNCLIYAVSNNMIQEIIKFFEQSSYNKLVRNLHKMGLTIDKFNVIRTKKLFRNLVKLNYCNYNYSLSTANMKGGKLNFKKFDQ